MQLESLCLGRNDNLLILDELAQIAAADAGGAAYLIANGQAKARMAKDGGNRPAQTWRVMLLLAAFMQAHSSTRFPPHDAAPELLARYLNRAGFTFTDDDGSLQFWVMPESFKKELCKGFQPRNAARSLIKAGWMLAGDIEGNTQRSTKQRRVKALNSTKVNVYILTSAALEGEE